MLTKTLSQIWTEMLSSLAETIEGRTWKVWLTATTPLTLEKGRLTVSVPNDFTKTTLQERYQPTIEAILSQICDGPMELIITVDRVDKQQTLFPGIQEQPEPQSIRPAMPAQTIAESSVPEFDTHLSPKYTFDNFIKGKSNDEAFTYSMAVANAPAYNYNPLFLYSDPGLGKTHLMNAIGNYIHLKYPGMKILYTSSETFTNELIGAIQHNTNESFRNKYRNIDVLLIDDIQFLRKKESTQEEFFHTFEALKQADKQIIISSDRPPKELDTLEERLTSRFMQGLIVEIKHPDLETRSAILLNMAEKDHIPFPPEVIQFIANNVKTNIRELEGAYTKVRAFASLNQQPITLELTRKALKDIDITGAMDKIITVEAIQDVVASRYKIRVDELKAKKRTRTVAYPRQIAMYLTRELTELSLPRIGECFGGRDHTTVLHACDKITEERKSNPLLEQQISQMIETLRK